MKRRLIFTLLCAAAVAAVACTREHAPTPAEPQDKILRASEQNSLRGVLMVKLADVADTRARAVTDAFDQIGATRVEPLFVTTPRNREEVRRQGLDRWFVVHFDEQASLETAARKLAEPAEVERVQYDVRLQKNTSRGFTPAAPATRADADAPFDDPRLGSQWHYHNTGDQAFLSPSVAGADIDLYPAWELCAGDPRVIVAIADEGVDYTHEDLRDNMWVNEAELNGTRAVDDDDNGYRDDVYGYNFGSQTAEISWGKTGDEGHGTHVAGTVSAVNNNGIGVGGVAGGTGHGDGVRLMSVQLWSGNDDASTYQIARAFQYAADNGAQILQCSWGLVTGQFGDDAAYVSKNSSMVEAMNYFITRDRGAASPLQGGLIVFAAGNNGRICAYPGAYQPVVCVTSVGADFTPSEFTNYGAAADIAAPGGDDGAHYTVGAEHCGVLSTLPTAFGNKYHTDGYAHMSGTSMAAPHVSGVAALGLSYAAKLGKTFTPEQFRTLLLAAVTPIDGYFVGQKTFTSYTDNQNIYHSSPITLDDYKNQMGGGLLDAYKMLMGVRGTKTITIGKTRTEVDLAPYLGGANVEYTLEVADAAKLGLTIERVDSHTVALTATRQGAALGAVVSTVGQTPMRREVALLVRAKVAGNGGWLK